MPVLCEASDPYISGFIKTERLSDMRNAVKFCCIKRKRESTKWGCCADVEKWDLAYEACAKVFEIWQREVDSEEARVKKLEVDEIGRVVDKFRAMP